MNTVTKFKRGREKERYEHINHLLPVLEELNLPGVSQQPKKVKGGIQDL